MEVEKTECELQALTLSARPRAFQPTLRHSGGSIRWSLWSRSKKHIWRRRRRSVSLWSSARRLPPAVVFLASDDADIVSAAIYDVIVGISANDNG